MTLCVLACTSCALDLSIALTQRLFISDQRFKSIRVQAYLESKGKTLFSTNSGSSIRTTTDRYLNTSLQWSLFGNEIDPSSVHYIRVLVYRGTFINGYLYSGISLFSGQTAKSKELSEQRANIFVQCHFFVKKQTIFVKKQTSLYTCSYRAIRLILKAFAIC